MINSKTLRIVLILLVAVAALFYAVKYTPQTDTGNIEGIDENGEKTNDSTVPPVGTTDSVSKPPSSASAPPLSSSVTPSVVPAPSQPQKGGRLVLAITDNAVSLEDTDAVYLSINGVSAQHTGKGWITISNELRTYDLLKLRREGKLELMFDLTTEEGTYNQLRLVISSVIIVKNGLANSAKLPSGTIIIPLAFPVKNGQISSVVLDIMADKSIHITQTGQYIFSPVLHVDTASEIQSVQKSGSKVEFFGGYPRYSLDFGMDETGAMVRNSSGIDSLSRIELIGNTYVLIPHSIDRSSLTVTPAAAIDTARNGAYIDGVLSVHAVLLDKQPTWLVNGSTNGNVLKIYVSGITGAVLKVEY